MAVIPLAVVESVVQLMVCKLHQLLLFGVLLAPHDAHLQKRQRLIKPNENIYRQLQVEVKEYF